MADNIHRQTFEEILNLDVKNDNARTLLDETSYWFVRPQQFGKIFCHSDMCIRKLLPDAQKRQQFAESVAKKYGCKISYCAIYSTEGRFNDLVQAREELIKTMYVSPVFWAPIGGRIEESCKYWNMRTFVFGFLPFCEKKQFKHVDSLTTKIIEDKHKCYPLTNGLWFEDICRDCYDTDGLHQLISYRINMIGQKVFADVIALSKEQFVLGTGDNRYVELPDDSNYPTDMSSQEYFQAVVHDNNANCFVIPEYKMMFSCEESSRLFDNWKMLSKRIAVSNIVTLTYKGKECYWFNYDDIRIDTLNQHFGFFDTWFYHYDDII